MVLGEAIAQVSFSLKKIYDEDGKSISSHEDKKRKALHLLTEFFKHAPDSEYKLLIQSDKLDCDIALGNTLYLLCQIVTDEKSRDLRLKSLDIISILLDRLERIHQDGEYDRCSLTYISISLPGVSCALFKLIRSDTKLPKQLIVSAIRTLRRYISVAFSKCHHVASTSHEKMARQTLEESLENLAKLIELLLDYIINNNRELSQGVLNETLEFCRDVINLTEAKLLTSVLEFVIKYISFIDTQEVTAETKLKVILIIDQIKDIIRTDGDDVNKLEYVICPLMNKLLDELDDHSLQMLTSERESKLSIFSGLLRLLPNSSMTVYLETGSRISQLLNLFYNLTDFSSQQPVLYLTHLKVEHSALEVKGKGISSAGKRFSHLSEREVDIIKSICKTIGRETEWLFLNDLFNRELSNFSSPNNLYITDSILSGCVERSTPIEPRFTLQMIDRYVDNIQELYSDLKNGHRQDIFSSDILTVVLSIDTIKTIVEIHLKFNSNDPGHEVVILRNLLCPLLYWCSSDCRAISETSLNALDKISSLYHSESIKDFIAKNIDYIVNGADLMLENLANNNEVTDVIAITFRLSSIETLYYFIDIFEKIFNVLKIYQYTEQSKSIAKLFFRTLSILSCWKDVNDHSARSKRPMEDAASLEAILNDLNIDKRIKRLQEISEKSHKIMQNYHDNSASGGLKEETLVDELKSSIDNNVQTYGDGEENDESKRDVKSQDILLTERMVKQCIGLVSTHHDDAKIFAMKAFIEGLKILRKHENILLPIVHQAWPSILNRLNSDFRANLEVILSAFECLVAMAEHSKDFIKRRTLDSVIPKLCILLESQAAQSSGQLDHGPYCMTLAYKCQLSILNNIGPLSYYIQLEYSCLWRIIKTVLLYLDRDQPPSLRDASLTSIQYLMALDTDCVWYYAKQENLLQQLPFDVIYTKVFC